MIMITACLQLTMGLLLLGGQRQVSSVHATSFRGAVYPVDERREVAPVQHKLPLTSILASLSDSSPVAAQERLAVKGSVSPNKKKKQFRRNLKKTCQPTPAPWTCPSTCTCQHDASICTTHSDCDTAGTCKNSEGPCSSDCDCNGGGDKCQGESAGTCLEATPPPTPPPTSIPTDNPTTAPTTSPTPNPTAHPTEDPTKAPSTPPTTSPTANPSKNPTEAPSTPPTFSPTANPTNAPTTAPPTTSPTPFPTSPPTTPVAQTCPEQHCSNAVANTATFDTVCPDVNITTLATYEYNNKVLIELRGPARNGAYNLSDAADLVITSPHGGDCDDDEGCDFIPDRNETGQYCPKGCKTAADSYTRQISELLQAKILANYCKVPFLVINHLHRIKLDANRNISEAAHGDPIAEEAWFAFHNLTNYAQQELRTQFGTSDVVNSPKNNRNYTGIHGLLIDMHGYAGYDWVPEQQPGGGSPLIQWGYRLNDDESLNPDVFCPLDRRSNYTAGTFTHARWMPNQTYECVVRGPGSLASRVATHIDARGGLPGQLAQCGHGTPSYEHESPWELANNAAYCDQMNDNPPKECHYFAGGFDIDVHERMDWQSVANDIDPLDTDHHMNSVQAELPRCIRWGNTTNTTIREEAWGEFADALSVAIYSFLRDLYGPI